VNVGFVELSRSHISYAFTPSTSDREDRYDCRRPRCARTVRPVRRSVDHTRPGRDHRIARPGHSVLASFRRDAGTRRDEVRDAFADMFRQWPEFGFHVHRVLIGQDHWVLDWALTAVLTGPDGSRRPVRFDCIDIVTIDERGLVARKDTFVDSTTSPPHYPP
jgi:hypothetical protein